MKPFLLFFLMLLSFSSHALIRKSATPTLHSVLDKKAESLPAFPMSTPPSLRPNRMTRDERRHEGKALTIVGGSIAVVGGGIIGYAAFRTAQNPNASTSSIAIAGALIAFVGLLIALIGLPIWLTHLRKSSPST